MCLDQNGNPEAVKRRAQLYVHGDTMSQVFCKDCRFCLVDFVTAPVLMIWFSENVVVA